MKLLVTGFEPFGGRTINASQVVVDGLANRLTLPTPWTLATAILPVDFQRTWPALKKALRRERPDALIMLGEKSGTGLWIETIARNRRQTKRGHYRISRTTPDVVENSLSLGLWFHEALHASGAEIFLSDDAGDYLCNFTYYKILTERARLPAFFIHVGAHGHGADGAAHSGHEQRIEIRDSNFERGK